MISFSVVLPLYNKQDYIVRALRSVLNQSYGNFDVLIVNDGSTDEGVRAVTDWLATLADHDAAKFNIIHQMNAGVSAARNRGVQEAKEDYVAFLDSDDYWESNHLSQLARLVEKYSDSVDVFSSYCLQQADVTLYPKLGIYSVCFGIVDFFEVSLISNGFINSSSCCVKRGVALEKPFPVSMKNFEDSLTWARWADTKGLAFSSEPSAVYFLENTAASSNVDWNNFLIFESVLMDKCQTHKKKLNQYLFKFYIVHALYARSTMSFLAYLSCSLPLLFKSRILCLPLVFSLFLPRSFLRLFRNIRKR